MSSYVRPADAVFAGGRLLATVRVQVCIQMYAIGKHRDAVKECGLMLVRMFLPREMSPECIRAPLVSNASLVVCLSRLTSLH
jgi:hypothetical protein